jgi:glycosyltransferase involved in cell wall biosynthesis
MMNDFEKRRLKILYIIPSFQHPKVRGPDRHYRIIRELSQRHDITLLTLVRSEIPDAILQELASYTSQIQTFGINSAANYASRNNKSTNAMIFHRLHQLWELRNTVKQMKKTFDHLVNANEYDVVLFHGKSVFPVISDFNSLPIVIDFCDATSLRLRQRMMQVKKVNLPLRWLQYFQVRQIERKMLKKSPHIAFISGRDREAILGPIDRFEIIPNGLDLDYWKRRSQNRRSNCLIFTGVMNYGPNKDAALFLIDEILPLLRKKVPGLELLIVGRDPTPSLVGRVKNNPEVTVTGYVDDMRTHLEQATIFVAPLRYGSGMQNKIQEALAVEVPVVATSIVAAGLRTEDGELPPIWVADGAQAFAERVVNLLGDKGERGRLSIAGRKFAEKHFDWSRSAREFEQMCFDAINNR